MLAFLHQVRDNLLINDEKFSIMNSISPTDPLQIEVVNRIASLAAAVDAESRSIAEKEVKAYQQSVDEKTGFAPLLLHVSSSKLPSAPFASIVFKNTVKMCWNPAEAEHCLMDEDKGLIRGSIICHTLSSDFPIVQRNLAEAIAFVAKLDFPVRWPTALDTLLEVIASPFSVPVHSTSLSIAHSVLIRYRNVEDSETFIKELRIINQSFLIPFLNMGLLPLAQAVRSYETGSTNEMRRKALEGVIAGVECLLDLSQLDVGDEFLSSIDKIVNLFLECLSLPFFHPLVVDLKSVVVQCVKHFLLCFDEDFEKYAGQFLKVVWDLIADPSSRDSSLDNLVVCGLDLLSSACQSTTRTLFGSQETITLLLNQVAMPNLSLTEDEIDLFQHEPDMYIQRDIEGSDLHTRRSAASSIIRQLVLSFADQACPILLEGTKQLFAASATDWHAKDTAIYLASSLLVDGKRADAQRGANVEAMGTIIPFETVVHGTILPELHSGVSAHSPLVIKADALRFIATFCARLDPLSTLPSLLPVLIQWLQCENRIVSSYAAHALRKMLLLTSSSSPLCTTGASPSLNPPSTQVLSESVLQPHAGVLLASLCAKIQESGVSCNPYPAQCLLQVLQCYPNVVTPFLMQLAFSLNNALTVVIKNPSHPLFSHCLFDSLSRCISLLRKQPDNMNREAGDDGKGQGENNCQLVEDLLVPNFTHILANDVVEYVPYTLQILAQLLDEHSGSNGGGAPPAFFQSLLHPLLSPELLQHRGSIPAVVRLLISYVEHFPEWLHHTGLTEKLLFTVRQLTQLKNYDHEGLSLLTSMVLSYPQALLQPHWPSIFHGLLHRLQVGKTPKYVRIFLIFLSITVVVCGAEEVVQVFESIQVGLFMMVLGKVWLDNLQKVTGALERKVCVVALVTLFCDCPFLQTNAKAWSSCVFRCWSMLFSEAEQDDHTSFIPTLGTPSALITPCERSSRLSGPSATSVSWVGLGGKENSGTGSSNIYCALEAAVHTPTDICRDIIDPVTYFRDKLFAFLRGPGVELQPALPQEVLALLNSA